ncbi:hypothetical protein QEN19_000893 [Hanseniaspora menglaensis]
MSVEDNIELLLDIIWPDQKSETINNTEALDARTKIHHKLTNDNTILLNRNLRLIPEGAKNKAIFDELVGLLINNNQSNQLESRLHRIIVENSGTIGFTDLKPDKKKTEAKAKPLSKRGAKKFTRMKVMENFNPVILEADGSNVMLNNTPTKKIETFNLIDLSDFSRDMAKKK